MLSHSRFVILLLWVCCSIIQSYSGENQTLNELESDVFFDGNLTSLEGMVENKLALDNDTFEDLDIPAEMINNTYYPLENENLFEGDLAIPKELIEEYYGNATRAKRGAVRNNNRLWPSGRVYYRYASDVSFYHKTVINSAINYFETHTCLRFYYRYSQRDYIEFTTNADKCYSDYIGCKGFKQVIGLGPGCRTRGIVLHEIGHAIGFWHEHSRPDRDSYVRIIESNIKSGLEYDFRKRTYSDIDSHSSPYDYGSIMHYRKTTFSRNNISPTIVVTNSRAYAYQGRPILGQRSRLSYGDIAQVNRLYDYCPSPARLRIYARNGHNLPDVDGWWKGQSDPYIEFVAYDLYGGWLRKLTSVDRNDNSPEWYQWLEFGTRVWKKLTFKVWDSDSGRDDSLSNTHSYNIYRGDHLNLGVNWPSRNGWVRFNYHYE